MLRRLISSLILAAFAVNTILPPQIAQAQTIGGIFLPNPGTIMAPSPAFVPVLIKGLKLHPENPLQFDFIVDNGHTKFNETEVKDESQKLIKYFFAALTVPANDFWVNLSPHESERIIPAELSKTELGRDLLAQDYILKQLTASFLSPESEVGKKFWDKIYKQAQEKFGTTDLPIKTFNKVWITPESATIYENGQTAYIVKSHLKVMLDGDYKAVSSQPSAVSPLKAESRELKADINDMSAHIMQEIVVPALEKEVNEGKHFAPLRQIYHSLLLAKWYKQMIKDTAFSKAYVDQNKVSGIDMDDKTVTNQIYNLYVDAYKKGAYTFIKEDYDALSEESIPRKYFTGGIRDNKDLAMTSAKNLSEADLLTGQAFEVSVGSNVNGRMINRAMLAPLPPPTPELLAAAEIVLQENAQRGPLDSFVHGIILRTYFDKGQDGIAIDGLTATLRDRIKQRGEGIVSFRTATHLERVMLIGILGEDDRVATNGDLIFLRNALKKPEQLSVSLDEKGVLTSDAKRRAKDAALRYPSFHDVPREDLNAKIDRSFSNVGLMVKNIMDDGKEYYAALLSARVEKISRRYNKGYRAGNAADFIEWAMDNAGTSSQLSRTALAKGFRVHRSAAKEILEEFNIQTSAPPPDRAMTASGFGIFVYEAPDIASISMETAIVVAVPVLGLSLWGVHELYNRGTVGGNIRRIEDHFRDDRQREEAAVFLGKRRRGFDPLLILIREEYDPEVLKAMEAGLRNLGAADRQIKQALLANLSQHSHHGSPTIVQRLKELGTTDQELADAYYILLGTVNWRSGAMGLGRLGDKRAVEPLIKILEDVGESVPSSFENFGIEIIEILGRLGDASAVQPLKDLRQRTSDEDLGAAIERALWQLAESGSDRVMTTGSTLAKFRLQAKDFLDKNVGREIPVNPAAITAVRAALGELNQYGLFVQKRGDIEISEGDLRGRITFSYQLIGHPEIKQVFVIKQGKFMIFVDDLYRRNAQTAQAFLAEISPADRAMLAVEAIKELIRQDIASSKGRPDLQSYTEILEIIQKDVMAGLESYGPNMSVREMWKLYLSLVDIFEGPRYSFNEDFVKSVTAVDGGTMAAVLRRQFEGLRRELEQKLMSDKGVNIDTVQLGILIADLNKLVEQAGNLPADDSIPYYKKSYLEEFRKGGFSFLAKIKEWVADIERAIQNERIAMKDLTEGLRTLNSMFVVRGAFGLPYDERIAQEVDEILGGNYAAMILARLKELENLLLDAQAPDPAMMTGKVLVVNDTPDTLELISLFLSSEGLTVIKAEDGDQVEALLLQHPDVLLIVSDIQMPRLEGRELARKLQQSHPAIPIIFATGFPDEGEYAAQALTGTSPNVKGVVRSGDLSSGLVNKIRSILPPDRAMIGNTFDSVVTDLSQGVYLVPEILITAMQKAANAGIVYSDTIPSLGKMYKGVRAALLNEFQSTGDPKIPALINILYNEHNKKRTTALFAQISSGTIFLPVEAALKSPESAVSAGTTQAFYKVYAEMTSAEHDFLAFAWAPISAQFPEVDLILRKYDATGGNFGYFMALMSPSLEMSPEELARIQWMIGKAREANAKIFTIGTALESMKGLDVPQNIKQALESYRSRANEPVAKIAFEILEKYYPRVEEEVAGFAQKIAEAYRSREADPQKAGQFIQGMKMSEAQTRLLREYLFAEFKDHAVAVAEDAKGRKILATKFHLDTFAESLLFDAIRNAPLIDQSDVEFYEVGQPVIMLRDQEKRSEIMLTTNDAKSKARNAFVNSAGEYRRFDENDAEQFVIRHGVTLKLGDYSYGLTDSEITIFDGKKTEIGRTGDKEFRKWLTVTMHLLLKTSLGLIVEGEDQGAIGDVPFYVEFNPNQLTITNSVVSRATGKIIGLREIIRGPLTELPAGVPPDPHEYSRLTGGVAFRLAQSVSQWRYFPITDLPDWKTVLNGDPFKIDRAMTGEDPQRQVLIRKRQELQRKLHMISALLSTETDGKLIRRDKMLRDGLRRVNLALKRLEEDLVGSDHAMMVNLKNGSVQSEPFVKRVYAALFRLYTDRSTFDGFWEAVDKARDPQHKVPKKFERDLKSLKLLNDSGDMTAGVRNVVLSSVTGSHRLEMRLVRPVDRAMTGEPSWSWIEETIISINRTVLQAAVASVTGKLSRIPVPSGKATLRQEFNAEKIILKRVLSGLRQKPALSILEIKDTLEALEGSRQRLRKTEDRFYNALGALIIETKTALNQLSIAAQPAQIQPIFEFIPKLESIRVPEGTNAVIVKEIAGFKDGIKGVLQRIRGSSEDLKVFHIMEALKDLEGVRGKLSAGRTSYERSLEALIIEINGTLNALPVFDLARQGGDRAMMDTFNKYKRIFLIAGVKAMVDRFGVVDPEHVPKLLALLDKYSPASDKITHDEDVNEAERNSSIEHLIRRVILVLNKYVEQALLEDESAVKIRKRLARTHPMEALLAARNLFLTGNLGHPASSWAAGTSRLYDAGMRLSNYAAAKAWYKALIAEGKFVSDAEENIRRIEYNNRTAQSYSDGTSAGVRDNLTETLGVVLTGRGEDQVILRPLPLPSAGDTDVPTDLPHRGGDRAMTGELSEPQLKMDNPYARKLQLLINGPQVTEESKKRWAVLRKIGPDLEKFIQSKFRNAEIRIAITPFGSTYRGYAAKGSDIEYVIFILRGLSQDDFLGQLEDEEKMESIWRYAAVLTQKEGYRSEEFLVEWRLIENAGNDKALRFLISELSARHVSSPGERGVWAPHSLYQPMAYAGDEQALEKARSDFLSMLIFQAEQDLWDKLRIEFKTVLRITSDIIESKPHLVAWLKSFGVDPNDKGVLSRFNRERLKQLELPVFDAMMDIYFPPSDEAMMSDVGGIDMNEIDFEKTGSGVQIEFNEENLKAIMPNGIQTLTPVIINIIPVTNILPLLGLQEKPQSELEISQAR